MRELAAFGTVGALAFVVDTGLFNLLRLHPASPLSHKPLTDKIISAGVATLLSWVGNRWWTYRHQRREALLPELLLFGVMNGLALLIAVGCLALSHYVLGFRSALADNVSGNLVGVGLGTAFRFLAYRTWVFRARDDVADLAGGPGAPVRTDAASTP